MHTFFSFTSQLHALRDSDEFLFGFDAMIAPLSSTFRVDDQNRIAVDLAKHFIKSRIGPVSEGFETLNVLCFMKNHAAYAKSLFAY